MTPELKEEPIIRATADLTIDAAKLFLTVTVHASHTEKVAESILQSNV